MGVTGQQGMITPPQHLILPSHLSRVRVALYSILYLPLDYGYVLHNVDFTILYFMRMKFYAYALFSSKHIIMCVIYYGLKVAGLQYGDCNMETVFDVNTAWSACTCKQSYSIINKHL
jgi:hypothetical protein